MAVQAQNATWSPGTGDWNMAANWAPATVPTGVATFGGATPTAITFSANASVSTLQFNAPAYSFSLTGFTLTITGSGIVNNPSNSSTFTSSSGGQLTFANTSSASNANITTGNGGITLFDNASTADNSAITVSNGGKLFLDATSTAGNAIITIDNGGQTFFSMTSTGGNARLINLPGGALDISGLTSGGITFGSIEGGGTYSLGGKALTVGLNNTSTVVSGTIVDGGFFGGTGGSLIKIGAGTLTLTGVNTYTGGTTVSGGVLSVASNFNLGNVSGGLTLDGGELLATGNGFNTLRSVTLTANGGTLAAAATGSADFEGNIVGAGALTIGDAVNTGTVVLGGTNTYMGTTTIVGGAALRANSTVALSPASAFIVIGTLDLNGFPSQIGSLAGAGTVTNGGSISAVLTTGGDATSTTFNGILQDGTQTLGLTKVGTGTLTLTGLNTYSGGTTVGGGVINVAADANLGATIGGITLQGGELLTTANFTTSRSILLNTSGPPDTLVAADGTTATYNGVISGAGVLKLGTSTLLTPATIVLNGNNLYNNETDIFGLTVVAGGNNALGTGPVKMFGGVLDIIAGVTLSNPIQLVLGGMVNNAGTLNNNITDAAGSPKVVINSGTINGNVQLGGQINFVEILTGSAINGDVSLTGQTDSVQLFNGSKITGNVSLSGTLGSTLILDGSGQQLFSSAVTGTVTNNGTLIKQGTGTWTIDENLSAPVGTDILAGTLVLSETLSTAQAKISPGATFQLGIGGTTGSYVGPIVDNGSLVFNRSNNVAFASVITGNGNVIQAGTGTTVLSGANTYSGGTIVDLGNLVVDNAQALGTGNVIVNGGVLSADPQPINVVGNYTQNAGGTLQLNIAGRGPGQFDVLNVGGNAFLNGTLRLINLGYQPSAGDKLRLVSTGGVVASKFSTFDNPFALAPGFNTIDLVYAKNSVTLEFLNLVPPVPPPNPPVIITIDFASFALTANQSAIATQLNNVQLEQKDPELIDFLQNEPFANLPADFNKISPESLSALYEISFSAANIQASNLEERFAEIRNGSTGFSSSLNVSNTPRAIVEGKDGKAIIEPGKGVLTPAPENKWGLWINGSGDYVSVSNDGNANGYDFTTGGVTLGLDYRLTRNLAVGVALGYAHTWSNLTGNGNLGTNSGRAGFYATYYQSGFYLNGYAGGGYNSYNTRRAGLGGSASGDTDGGEFDGYISGGYEFHYGGFTFGPIAALQYTYVGISGNTESGSLAPLQIKSDSVDSLRTNLGVTVSYAAKVGKVGVTPSLRASWQHEYLYSALPITAQFANGGGNAFTVVGPAEGHDSALINAGVNVQWTPTIGAYFGYNGQVGRSRYDSQGGVCSVHIDF